MIWIALGLAVLAAVGWWLWAGNCEAETELKKYVGVEGQWTLADYRAIISKAVKERDAALAEIRELSAALAYRGERVDILEARLAYVKDERDKARKELKDARGKARRKPKRHKDGRFKKAGKA